MDSRAVRMLLAVLIFAAGAFSADVWRRHRGELARLTEEAKADLRDAVKAEKQVIRRYVYEPWPYWWGYPYYGWWEDRRTIIVQPAPQAQPAPERRTEVGGVSASPEVGVEAPVAEPARPLHSPAQQDVRPEPAPLQKVRRRLPPL